MNIVEKREFLKSKIVEVKGKPVVFTEDTKLSELGLDSLDVVELQMMYEDAFHVELEDPVDPIVTVGDLLKMMT